MSVVSKITDMEAKQNFVILLHCLHFLTKRAFVYTPKNGEPIKVGRRKRKEKAQPWENIPSAGASLPMPLWLIRLCVVLIHPRPKQKR